MRVAILTGSTHKIPRLGREARIFHMAKFLASCGIDIGLFGSRFAEESLSPRMSQLHTIERWSGGDWYPLSIRNAPTLVRSVPSLFRLSRTLEGYDAAISELGAAWEALWLKRINRLPILLDEHNVEWHMMHQQELSRNRPYPWRRLRTYERFCHKGFDYILVVSDIDKAFFEASGTSGQKMTVVPNGVDTVAFRPSGELGQMIRDVYRLKKNDPLVMYMGSLKFFPNVDAVSSILKTIYPKAQNMVPNLKLMITGPGYENLSNSIPNEIILTGVVDRSLLPSYINAADLCVAPLRFGSGTRFKILEWMSCGRAIIATRKAVEGIEVTDGDNVILEDDIEKYPALISNLCHDNSVRTKLGKSARKLAETKYSWETCIAPLGELLRGMSA